MSRKANAKKVFTPVHPHAAGIDVGNTLHYVAVSPESCHEGESCVREFPTFTADLYRIADWLKECACALGIAVVATTAALGIGVPFGGRQWCLSIAALVAALARWWWMAIRDSRVEPTALGPPDPP